jgi:histidine ammonia-lyase
VRFIRKATYAGLVLIAIASSPVYANEAAVTLTGHDLTIQDLVRVSMADESNIKITDAAAQRVENGFDVVKKAALQGNPVYGLNVGVGWNKDQPVFKRNENGEKVLNGKLLKVSRKFNADTLRAHAGGIGPEFSREAVRAGMLIRLNTMLDGAAGVSPAVMRMYQAFLDKGITPVVPSKGSVGEADITLNAHIGIAMMGEGDVYYDGKRRPASKVLKELHIKPLAPVGKDFLAIISTNAITTGREAMLAAEAQEYLEKVAPVVFALALEGWNGNVAPYLPATTNIRPYPGMLEAAKKIRSALKGSYLWQPHKNRALQDPLSYRTMGYVLGNALHYSEDLYKMVKKQLNWTDDNPVVIPGKFSPGMADSEQAATYRVKGNENGAIYPTANFEQLPLASRVEDLNQALARLSLNIAMETIRYENPDLTHLARFLAAPDNPYHAFGAMQKPVTSLFAENVQLAMPVSSITLAMAGNIEDTATNAPLGAGNLKKILDNIYRMSSVEMLHATQAVDLRHGVTLGDKTQKLYDAYRAKVPFVEKDRPYAPDFAAGVKVLHAFGDDND